MNKSIVLHGLKKIIASFKDSGVDISLTYRGEKSHLIRAGRNQISLNVGEEGSSFQVKIQKEKRFIAGSLTAEENDTDKVEAYINELISKIDLMPEVPHLKEMSPQAEAIEQEEADPKIREFDSSIAVKYFKDAFELFKAENIEVSGAFSAGFHNIAIVSTLSPVPSYYEGTDFNIELVLQLLDHDKKELRVSQVGRSLSDYDPEKTYQHLKKVMKIKSQTKRIDLPPGKYDVIFHADAFAEMTAYMSWLTFSGDHWLYQTGMLQKGSHDLGTKIFGENFNISDDPHDEEVLFHRPFGLNGVVRNKTTPVKTGIIESLYHSDKETSDKFNVEVNNCSSVSSFKVSKGDGPNSFEELALNSKTKTLYIPFIHYMNFTNPAKGEFTGTSRFGTFLLEDGKLKNHIYNLRINDSFHHIFNQIEWLSSKLEHVNLSNTYGLRLANSLTCPRYVKVSGVNISGSSGTSKA
ncbi:MAG: putative Zn-dependent protease [Bacteriovoracaceae bacterium]|jgi:predicted Zn-dependent protease